MKFFKNFVKFVLKVSLCICRPNCIVYYLQQYDNLHDTGAIFCIICVDIDVAY